MSVQRDIRSAATVAAAFGVWIVGCSSPGDAPAVRRFVEDGVEVVESVRPAWGEGVGWRLTDQPELAIGEGTDDPRYLFSAITGGRLLGEGNFLGPYRLADGQIVAGDLQSVEVRYFDAAGELVRAAVGQGEGPTELTRIRQLHRCGPSTLFAIDNGVDLLAVLDAEGELHGRYFFEANFGRPMYGPIACNDHGQLLTMDWGAELADDRDRTDGAYRSRVHIWLLDTEGFVLHDLGEFPGVDRLRYGGGGSSPHLIGRTTQRALASDRVFIGTADRFEVGVWSLDGVLQQRWRRPTGDLSVSRSVIDELLAEEATESRFGEELRDLRRWFPEIPMPEQQPAYTRFVLDAAGRLWVEHYRFLDRGPRLWTVFAADGVWLGEVEMPPTFRLTEVGDDYVLGVWFDDLDEQSIRMYGLLK